MDRAPRSGSGAVSDMSDTARDRLIGASCNLTTTHALGSVVLCRKAQILPALRQLLPDTTIRRPPR